MMFTTNLVLRGRLADLLYVASCSIRGAVQPKLVLSAQVDAIVDGARAAALTSAKTDSYVPMRTSLGAISSACCRNAVRPPLVASRSAPGVHTELTRIRPVARWIRTRAARWPFSARTGATT
jgi:hypothetical protein